jgi:AraC-like DNA-binding protein
MRWPAGSMTARNDKTPAFDVVHAKILLGFPELVAELGGDLRALVTASGLAESHLSAATYRHIVHLLELAAAALDCPDFGMRLATRQRGESMFGPLGSVMRHSRTFGEALDYVCSHGYAHSLAARIWLQRRPGAKAVFVGHDILLDRAPNKTQAVEQIMLVGALAAAQITGGQARARAIHFRHQPISPLAVYRRYFGCDVRFDQNEDGVLFSERDLAARIVDPDADLYQRAIAFIDAAFTRHRPPLHADARGVIMRLLGTDDCTNARVAAELHLHPRTLHRRLKAEGASFQDLKDEVRRDFMLYYLQQTDLDCASISARLGFAEQSVMTRRCHHWFAASPTQLRQAKPHPPAKARHRPRAVPQTGA